jgi:26S proteasome regulatory subunit T1
MPVEKEPTEEKKSVSLDKEDIDLLKKYGHGPYTSRLKAVEDDISRLTKSVDTLKGIKESDTGLSLPSQWDLVHDKYHFDGAVLFCFFFTFFSFRDRIKI